MMRIASTGLPATGALLAAALLAAGCGSTSTPSRGDAAAATTTGATAAAPPASGAAGSGAAPAAPPGQGTVATGAAATKAATAALGKYPGKIQVVLQVPNGSYVVHVIRPSGELHALVSKAFKVTGVEQGGPPGAGAGGGTAVNDAAGKLAAAAALAKYPGSIQVVLRLANGSYVVHVIRPGGELHVLVSKDYKVTGVERGPGGPPPGGTTTAPPGTSPA